MAEVGSGRIAGFGLRPGRAIAATGDNVSSAGARKIGSGLGGCALNLVES